MRTLNELKVIQDKEKLLDKDKYTKQMLSDKDNLHLLECCKKEIERRVTLLFSEKSYLSINFYSVFDTVILDNPEIRCPYSGEDYNIISYQTIEKLKSVCKSSGYKVEGYNIVFNKRFIYKERIIDAALKIIVPLCYAILIPLAFIFIEYIISSI